jgi:hypothetical protein
MVTQRRGSGKTRRRTQVLIKSNAEVAALLKATPGQWFWIACGPKRRARVYSQTAYRINQNYRPDDTGSPQGLGPFAADETGEFEAVATADQSRPDMVAEAEIRARWKPVGWVD